MSLCLCHLIMILQQTAELHLSLKPSLSGDADSGEDGGVFTPQTNTIEVIRAVLIIDDDWGDIVTEALRYLLK